LSKSEIMSFWELAGVVVVVGEEVLGCGVSGVAGDGIVAVVAAGRGLAVFGGTVRWFEGAGGACANAASSSSR
jgi:hypothetical protein